MGLFCAYLAVLVAVLAALPMSFELLLARTFAVHSAGGILVTGASTGIGRHAAEELSRSGYTVYATVRKEADAAALRELGIAALVPVICDVTDSASIASAVTEIEKAGLPLIANANINDRRYTAWQRMRSLAT